MLVGNIVNGDRVSRDDAPFAIDSRFLVTIVILTTKGVVHAKLLYVSATNQFRNLVTSTT